MTSSELLRHGKSLNTVTLQKSNKQSTNAENSVHKIEQTQYVSSKQKYVQNNNKCVTMKKYNKFIHER